MILDSETESFIRIAQREAPYAMLKQTGLVAMGSDVPLRPEVEQWLRGRVEWIQAGIDRCPSWFKKTLARFDASLRVRWDSYWEHWVIERLSPTDNLYHRCGVWAGALGPGLIEALHQGDMWKTSTAEKIQQVEDRAAKQREQNDKKAREGWLERVDNLSRRQAEDFVEVSRALEHGETLTFAGPDADFMNKVFEEKKNRPDIEDTPMNPGMKPGTYQRSER